MTGTSNAAANSGIGIRVQGGSTVAGLNVTLVGRGSVNTSYSDNWGVSLEGSAAAPSYILTSTFKPRSAGSISITGSGGGASRGYGIYIKDSVMRAYGNDTINLVGSGSGVTGSVNSNDGIEFSAAAVQTDYGSLTLTGTAGTGAASRGIALASTTLAVNGSNWIVSYNGGTITLNADSLSLPARTLATSDAGYFYSPGALVVQPLTVSTTIGVGTGAGTLSIPASAFSSAVGDGNGNFMKGFGSITIGRSDGTGQISATGFSFSDPLVLQNSSGGIALAGAINGVTSSASFTALAGTGAISGSGSLSSSGIAITLDQGAAGTYSGVIGGSTNLIKNGVGVLTLSGANSYTGLTYINAGGINLGAAGSGANTPLGTTGGGTVVADGANLDLNGFTLVTAEGLTLNGTGISGGGALSNNAATAATYSGLIALGSDTSIVAGSGNIVLSNTGTITGSGFGLTGSPDDNAQRDTDDDGKHGEGNGLIGFQLSFLGQWCSGGCWSCGARCGNHCSGSGSGRSGNCCRRARCGRSFLRLFSKGGCGNGEN